MTTYESHKATVEARKAVASSTAPVSRHEEAMHQYLTATAHLSEPVSRGPVPPAAEPIADRPTNLATAPEENPVTQMPIPRSDLVVVGIDGSGCARHAAQWAAAEATRRHGALRLVHAYSLPPAGYSGYNPYPAPLLAQLREEGQALLAGAAAELRRDHPTLDISTHQTHGDTATVLRDASMGALLTVIGAHGRNRVAVALGSVAADIAATNPVPVAVIRPGDTPDVGPVVVGVDGSATSEAAIAFAFDAAAVRGTGLVAVHSWTDPSVDGPVPAYSAVIADPDPIAHAERMLLAERLAGWADKYPDVPVQQVLVHDRPAPALLKHAANAQLVVVGTRGHGRLTSVLLGSTSHALISHAACPVVIARPHPAN
jgi:nucleotide-binding universal stress UspA family protein